MLKNLPTKLSLTTLLALALTGCATAAGPAPSTSLAPPAPPANGGTYGTVEALKDAYIAAGGVCNSFKPDEAPFLAAQSGYCSPGAQLGTYSSEEDKQEYVSYFKDFSSGGPNSILIGENWILFGEADLVTETQPLLGGIVVNSSK